MDALARIIDANANRCREGLRVLEDAARFGLNDQDLCARVKSVRHGVRDALAGLGVPESHLLGARDSAGDVGTRVSTDAERTRRDLADIAAAGAKRAGEALRVLEETAKASGADGSAFESLRYLVYDAERDVVGALRARPGQWALCVIVSTDLCAGRDPAWVAEQAIEGGADCIQVREKTMDARGVVDVARSVVGVCRPRGVPVIVNDRADVATASGADGVHVGQADLRVADARRVLGPAAIVGVSTTGMDQALAAADAGASYCGCGAMFETSTKARPNVVGPEYLRAYLADERTSAIPHLAIGGITPANAGELAAAGCRGVAVSSAACGADDPAEACRAIASALAVGAH
ncbi:MAG: thiamine phosphate synthase [Phycisphaerales bacterium]